MTEFAGSEFPGVPGGIFTVSNGKLDQYIVVSFADASLVLSVGDTVEEVGKESGFVTNSPSLTCTALEKEEAVVKYIPVEFVILKMDKPSNGLVPFSSVLNMLREMKHRS